MILLINLIIFMMTILLPLECEAGDNSSLRNYQKYTSEMPQLPKGVRMKKVSQTKDEVDIVFIAEVDNRVERIVLSFLDNDDFLMCSERFGGLYEKELTTELLDGKKFLRGIFTLSTARWNHCMRIGIADYW